MKMTFRITVIGGILVFFAVVLAAVFIPRAIWSPPQTVVAHPYTETQLAGREVFYKNGCDYCHTQYVRAQDTAMGPVSQGGNYVFDQPMILGSERTGPDLSYIGRKRSEQWEIDHWKNPREMSPLSIMPSFEFLSDQELSDMSEYLFNLGDRVAYEYMILPPAPYASSSDPFMVPLTDTTTSGDAARGWPAWRAANLQQGKEHYVKYCLTCHGCSGNGLGSYAGTLIVTPADFKQEPFRSMPADQWFWHVSEGVQGTVMPPWKESLTEEERWTIIRYVHTIFAQPVDHDPSEGEPFGAYVGASNPLPKTVEVLDEGKHIFIRECWVCHGDAGRGHGIYRSGLQPVPPDFGDGSYGDFTDADYFWRISEGVPWTAMPAWKVHYGEEDRWKLVYYIRVNFTQTEPRPEVTSPQEYPLIDLQQTMPQGLPEDQIIEGDQPHFENLGPSAMAGKMMFAMMCARCHGMSGTGDGWDGQYLNPKPANLTGEDARSLTDGDFFARVTYGLQDSAMPSWGEFMPIRNRWNVIKYIQDAYIVGMPSTSSVYNNEVPVTYLQANSAIYLDEGHTISVTHGADIYTSHCATCHGANGQGNGPATQGTPSGGPAAFPAGMPEQYIYWRIAEGVPDTVMGPFSALLSENDIWDLTKYLQNLVGGSAGGG
jgi:mono/diheme cytochrome c family protein